MVKRIILSIIEFDTPWLLILFGMVFMSLFYLLGMMFEAPRSTESAADPIVSERRLKDGYSK